MELKINLDVNSELKTALRLSLEDVACSEGEEDRRYTESLIAELENKYNVDEWSDELRGELALFLMFRAGFQSAAGYTVKDFEE